ncbi:MAG: AAA family ATPase [Gammaproteobacteria bacterium]|nr:AAA family ATPase [Gammaproteobacteria bacterium]MDH4314139.1 AAA family ATPase [Gammaproteobacteria bacterium]MDH5212779.1 AAA family ATPase [Gammaproteobacteria bacterium]MDH5500391.1 AAA family ATPase [Gammaproteobacteria bacterium]
MPKSSCKEVYSNVISALLLSDAYSHPTNGIELLETHISWVLLAGDYAYKIKKPLALGFLDFSTIESRRFYCEEEIRLNRTWAPEIYIGVVHITRVEGRPTMGGDGEAIEYAVQMRRFDQVLRLDRQLENGRLKTEDMRELGANIADRHARAAAVPPDQRQRALDLTESQMWDNYSALHSVVGEKLLSSLQEWTQMQLQVLRPLIHERFDRGFYRECHGDLHLANLVRLPGGITTFDCIEFSSDLRNIDVACDIAFLVMDLESRGRDDLAAHFINRYLEKSNDYKGIQLFDLYFVYRCLVRAKVAAIRAGERDDDESGQRDLADVRRYCEMAARQTSRPRPVLVLMHGLSGSGKTWISERLMAGLPAIRIRSDLQRKSLFGMHELEKSGSPVAQGIYAPEADVAVYRRMSELAETVLCSGHNVILDATYLHLADRENAIEIARASGVSAVIVQTRAPDDELRRRIASRARRGSDASEADLAVLEHQLQSLQPLTDEERRHSITLDTRDAYAVERLSHSVRRLAQRTAPEA